MRHQERAHDKVLKVKIETRASKSGKIKLFFRLMIGKRCFRMAARKILKTNLGELKLPR